MFHEKTKQGQYQNHTNRAKWALENYSENEKNSYAQNCTLIYGSKQERIDLATVCSRVSIPAQQLLQTLMETLQLYTVWAKVLWYTLCFVLPQKYSKHISSQKY